MAQDNSMDMDKYIWTYLTAMNFTINLFSFHCLKNIPFSNLKLMKHLFL